MAEQEKVLVNIITDVGEEIDDETALFYLKEYVNKNQNIFLNIILCNGKMSSIERLQILKEFIGEENENIKYILIQDKENIDMNTKHAIQMYNQRYILQIGPVYDDELGSMEILKNNLGNYTYHLLGNLGNSLNSNPKCNAFTCANYLYENATKKLILETKMNGETVIPCFTPIIAEWFGTKLKNEIFKIGFRNTVGRAPPLPYTIHLVGHNGANYESVKNLYESVYSSFESIEITEQSFQSSMEYVNKVKEHPHFNNEFMKNQQTLLKQTLESQIEGLARIIEALHILLGLPREIIYSDNSKFNDCEKCFDLSWNNYLYILSSNHNIKMTPAYDLVGAISIVKTIENKFEDYFYNNIFIHYQDSFILYTILNSV